VVGLRVGEPTVRRRPVIATDGRGVPVDGVRLLLPRESGSGGYYWEDDGQATLTFVNRTVSTGVPIPPMTVELRLSGQTRA
jgi:hypothetical protein